MSDHSFDEPDKPVLTVKQELLAIAISLLLPGALVALGGLSAMVALMVIGWVIWLVRGLGPVWTLLLILFGMSR
ncbi:MAG: hypothetical protein FWC58_03780 [Desulfobulbus sp.]|nr:hypothetical protein [Desulfobulbus sp.]